VRIDNCATCGQRRLIWGYSCCRACYYQHHRDVKAGRTNWAALEAQGKARAVPQTIFSTTGTPKPQLEPSA
jgi:hypothetical protein